MCICTFVFDKKNVFVNTQISDLFSRRRRCKILEAGNPRMSCQPILNAPRLVYSFDNFDWLLEGGASIWNVSIIFCDSSDESITDI